MTTANTNMLVTEKSAFPYDYLISLSEKYPRVLILFGGDRWTCVDYVAYAVKENELIGMATLSLRGEDYSNTPSLVGIWVDPAFRRKGIGTELASLLIEQAKALEVKRITASVITVSGYHFMTKLAEKYDGDVEISYTKEGTVDMSAFVPTIDILFG